MPQVKIEPPGDRHVNYGSSVQIDCHITNVVQTPDYIFWYQDEVRVLDSTDPNLEVGTSSGTKTKSGYLIVPTPT